LRSASTAAARSADASTTAMPASKPLPDDMLVIGGKRLGEGPSAACAADGPAACKSWERYSTPLTLTAQFTALSAKERASGGKIWHRSHAPR
jgi:hypothetical protein